MIEARDVRYPIEICLDNWDLLTVIIVEVYGIGYHSVLQFHLVGLLPLCINAIARLWSKKRTTSWSQEGVHIRPPICGASLKSPLSRIEVPSTFTGQTKHAIKFAISNTCRMIFLDINNAVYGGNIHWKKTGQWLGNQRAWRLVAR